MHWKMAWDLFWFRTFAKCSHEWFDYVMTITYVENGGDWHDNDNKPEGIKG